VSSTTSSRARRLRAAIAVAVAIAAPAIAGRARAAGTPPVSRPNLEIVIVGPQGAADLLAVAIAPLITELEPVSWRQLRETTPVSDDAYEPRPGAVRIWIDAHRTGTVTVVGLSRTGAPGVRSVEAPDLTPVVAETIGQIVRETAVALMSAAAEARTDAPASLILSDERPAARDLEEPETPAVTPPPASRFRGSLAFGYVLRQMAGFGEQNAQGVTVSTTAWLQHRTVRSFATLALDSLQGSGSASGTGTYAISIVPTVGISRRIGGGVDVRAAMGIGADRMNYGAISWYPVGRASAAASLPLPAGFEAMTAVMVDAVVWADFRQRVYQPAMMVGVGWRP